MPIQENLHILNNKIINSSNLSSRNMSLSPKKSKTKLFQISKWFICSERRFGNGLPSIHYCGRNILNQIESNYLFTEAKPCGDKTMLYY